MPEDFATKNVSKQKKTNKKENKENKKQKTGKEIEKICLFPDYFCKSEAHTEHQESVQS